jgi:PGF-pre-PGF domain-containing protein
MNESSLRLVVDGTDVTDEATIAEASASYTLPVSPDSTHTLEAELADVEGNLVQRAATFDVAARPPAIVNVTPSDGATLPAGTSEVAVNVSYEPGTHPIATDEVALAVEGTPLADAHATTQRLTGTLGVDPGTSYELAITVPDTAGNEATRSIGFSIEEASSSGGGGGGGGSSTPTADASETIEVDQDETFDAEAEATVVVEPGTAALDEVSLELAEACKGCRVETQALEAPPEGTPTPEGFADQRYVAMELTDGETDASDAIETGTVRATLDETSAEPEQVVLLRHADGWNALLTDASRTEDGRLVAEAELPGFSTFAWAVDEDPADVRDPEPAPGTTASAQPTFAARLADERGIATGTLKVQVGDRAPVLVDADPDGFTYTPEVPLDPGSTNVTVTLEDDSGLETSETWSFTVEGDEPLEPASQPEDTSQDAGGTEPTTGPDEQAGGGSMWPPVAALAIVGASLAAWYVRYEHG